MSRKVRMGIDVGGTHMKAVAIDNQIFLADMKTCDEGEYEFRKAYEAGADIATVMGFSDLSTIRSCGETAKAFRKDYMIDLLEVKEERIAVLAHEFPTAYFAIHLPADREGNGFEDLVRKEVRQLGSGVKIAAAGGIRLNPRVVEYCRNQEIPMMPGIATATEVEEAMKLGLHAVKFFPAGPMGGLRTIKAPSAPYRNMEFMPTGGINAANAAEYLAFDRIYAIGGSWVAPAALIQKKQFGQIRKNAAEASAIVRQARG